METQRLQYTLRFVVLHHTGIDSPHFDLLFETAPGSELTGIRLSEWPPTPETHFEMSSVHRRHYLTFEGELSGQRGRVRQVASGICRIEQDDRFLTVKTDAEVSISWLRNP